MKNAVLCLLGIMTFPLGADENIFAWKTGDFEVYTLVENRGPGRQGVLVGAAAADVERYLGGGFQSQTNAFLIKASGRIVLVDTGFGAALFDNLKALGVNPGQVDAVLITHMHGDHIGGLARDGQALFPNARVYLAEQERGYWTKSNMNRSAVAALAPYGEKVTVFRPGELGKAVPEILPGISAAAAFGHTPGHTVFLLESREEKLLIWGDLVHVQGIQFPLPGVSVTYDTDPREAAVSRKRILSYVTANGIPVAGMHLVYPALGTVRAEGDGYRLEDAKRN
ncbi:MAG: MBL fold metallo-hydrolase [Treponema sp.]|jgi:glyoxylase-like metal-dependent hydrolase (beta-lactamase superfamily II)|nr:MBL fold metallo-hydrolase [Treponema sp.]